MSNSRTLNTAKKREQRERGEERQTDRQRHRQKERDRQTVTEADMGQRNREGKRITNRALRE